jgi:hypothetical protein
MKNPGADPDGDGMSNLWEYATGGNPRAADLTIVGGESRIPRMALKEEDGGSFIEFTFVRVIDALERGLDFVIETSPTMMAGSWTAQPATLAGPPETVGDGTLERVVLRMNESVAGSSQMFARLRAIVRD